MLSFHGPAWIEGNMCLRRRYAKFVRVCSIQYLFVLEGLHDNGSDD